MTDKLKKDCSNGIVYEKLDGVKIGDIYQYDPHRFSDFYKQYMVIYLYKSQGGNIAQIIYDDGFVEPYGDTKTIKTDKFIKNVELKNKTIDYSVLEQVKKDNKNINKAKEQN